MGGGVLPRRHHLATAATDQTARLWDTTTGTTRATLTGHTSPVWGVAFSPDGTTLATAIRRPDRPPVGHHHRHPTGATLTGHTSPVWRGGVLPRRHHPRHRHRRPDRPPVGHHHRPPPAPPSPATPARCGGWRSPPTAPPSPPPPPTETARLWDTTTGTIGTTLTGHTSAVRRGGVLPRRRHRSTTASYDGTARLWDTATGTTRTTLTGHTGPVLGVAFSPDGATVATTSYDETARLWDATTGTTRTTLTGHTSPVLGVAFSPDGTTVTTTSYDRTARLWDTATGTLRATLLPLVDGGFAVLLPDGSYKLSGDPGDAFWWAMKLCRFAPGELDDYVPQLRRLPEDAPIL